MSKSGFKRSSELLMRYLEAYISSHLYLLLLLEKCPAVCDKLPPSKKLVKCYIRKKPYLHRAPRILLSI